MIQAATPQNIERELSLIQEVITKGMYGIIVLPAKLSVDAAASGAALYLALSKLGKTVGLISQSKSDLDLVGLEKIQNKVSAGGDSLVISFPYKEGAIDKVDYNIEGEKFNLIIAPREGNAKLDPTQVEYSYTGARIDFIITLDVPTLASLGEVYEKNKNQFDGKNIINIDRHIVNQNYGVINLVQKTASSTAELVFEVIRALKIDMDRDVATNLYSGLSAATNNFSSYSVNAETFEMAAQLLRSGAVKKIVKPQGQGGYFPNPFSQKRDQVRAPQVQIPEGFGLSDDESEEKNTLQPQVYAQPRVPQNFQKPPSTGLNNAKPVEVLEKEANPQVSETDENSNNWLKPKIFSESGGLV